MPNLAHQFFFFIVLLGLPSLCFSASSFSGGYQVFDLQSATVQDASISGFGMGADYLLLPDTVGPLDVGLGSSAFIGNAAWKNGTIERAGFLNEVTFDLLLDYADKDVFYLAGLKIPVYSEMLMSGAFNTNTTQGNLESTSEATYTGSGSDLYFGAEYLVGYLKAFSANLQTTLGFEYSIVSRSFAIDNTTVVSSFSDYSGPVANTTELSGTSMKFSVKFRIN
ncbi:hypothetical protein N9W79_00795 [bacterium]|nr:hypothetical protein [bacterium]